MNGMLKKHILSTFMLKSGNRLIADIFALRELIWD